ncbi:MAG TPA: anti-sigma factor [Acidobacteriaceae bacterium]|jgi:anti-sigma-K factor RskA|nr:anti-sigma factor [Acidobacteriaceae bacterium]
MADATPHTGRIHPLNWIGWVLAVLFLAAAAGLAHHVAFLRAQVNSAQGDAAQVRVQLQHANQIVAVLTSPDATHIVLTETRQPVHPVGQVSWLAAQGALVFVAGGLKEIPADRIYELWLIPMTGKAPIPAGLFRPDADHGATVVLPALPADTQAKSFLVTVEPGHGSETPSLPIVMQGEAAK